MKDQTTYNLQTDFLRVATATPEVHITHCQKNVQKITYLYKEAVTKKVALVVFPELCITGYSLGDLVQRDDLLQNAQKGLIELAQKTSKGRTVMVVGLPIRVNNQLYNCAAVLAGGEVKGLVPKQNMPNYKEFYEQRWYSTWTGDNTELTVGDKKVPFGTHQLFNVADTLVGIEICEDLWMPNPPSQDLALNGALVICNPSASPEIVSKGEYRRQLVTSTSARLLAGYVYASAEASESTAEIVMSGHSLIAEGGRLLAERQPFDDNAPRLVVADIDIAHLKLDRTQNTNFTNAHNYEVVECGGARTQKDFIGSVNRAPFVPTGDSARLDTILNIQAHGLKKRLQSLPAKQQRVILGLSGGLDSTLALLVAVRTAKLLGIPAKKCIHAITMPSHASSKRTQTNAEKLANALGIAHEIIPIGELAKDQLIALGHDGKKEDVAYENVQARLRTAILFNKANQIGGVVLGTGDLSEIALGWCTYNGDHMSGYNVNASVPKTLVRSLVAHASEQLNNKVAQVILEDILDTPVSPELTGNKAGISQKTEDIIGPYELHDFFLYHFIRWMSPVDKIQFLATVGFAGSYSEAEIKKWIKVFIKRFYANQWKRQAMPDGPKVGTVSLSPKGDWRMPPDTL